MIIGLKQLAGGRNWKGTTLEPGAGFNQQVHQVPSKCPKESHRRFVSSFSSREKVAEGRMRDIIPSLDFFSLTLPSLQRLWRPRCPELCEGPPKRRGKSL
jgi:hypothetical protein